MKNYPSNSQPVTGKLTKSNSKTDQNKATAQVSGSVRIIGGRFKRRTVSFIDADGLRPTPDRLRETLFNWLLADIHSARVLDSCAGSGVLGLEALSRGAAHCTFIEANQRQAQTLSKTFDQLCLNSQSYQLMHGRAEQVLDQKTNFEQPFDLVFIDPPYAHNLWQPILLALITNNLIHSDTLIYLEADKDLAELLESLSAAIKKEFGQERFKGFNCLKQTQVGQVVAGLYRLSSS